MDEIKKRLKETSENCEESYDVWTKKPSDDEVRETLLGHIHELRKVASRLEIEIAMSERQQMQSKRIPIPAHRASRQNKNNDDDNADNDDNKPEVKQIKRRGRKSKTANGDD